MRISGGSAAELQRSWILRWTELNSCHITTGHGFSCPRKQLLLESRFDLAGQNGSLTPQRRVDEYLLEDMSTVLRTQPESFYMDHYFCRVE